MTINDAIIGYSGFVGKNLMSQNVFSSFYNSGNIERIKGREFGMVICCAAPGVKWKVNSNPVKDKENILNLIGHIQGVKINKLVLISTIDVYSPCEGVDEATIPDNRLLHAYGSNRIMLEDFVSSKFDALIIRLPSIFGLHTTGGILYDIIRKNYQYIPSSGKIQFYDLSHLWEDIQIAIASGIGLLNIATEPIDIKEIRDLFHTDKGTSFDRSYDMRSKYAGLWGKQGCYLYNREEVIADIKLRYE